MQSSLVLSSTGGDIFFYSGVDLVHIRRVKKDVDGLYKKLGVSPNASDEDIKLKAKQLMLDTHPDRGGSEDAFMEIHQAYEVLTDKAKRAVYDNKTVLEALYDSTTPYMPSEPEPDPQIRSAYYKEFDIIMSDKDEREVDLWIRLLLEAAIVHNVKQKIVIAIRKTVQNTYALENNIYTIQHGRKPEPYMAHVLMIFQKEKN